jgi:hypothetical protein
MKPLLLRICLAVTAALVVVSSVLAQQQGQPLKVTATVAVIFVGPDLTFDLPGTGTGTIGDFDHEGYVTFVTNEGGQIFAYGSSTLITADGDLYLEISGHSGRSAAQASYRITGGTGIYEGASGAGAFKAVAVTPDFSVQEATFNGSLVVPADAP